MPIEFEFKRLEIRNFRGLQSVDLELPSKCLNVLIGANNSGKSTILDAIALVLEGPSSYNYNPEKYDFHHSSSDSCSDEFEIKMAFSAATEKALPAVRGGYGDPTLVYGACLTGHIEKNDRYSHQTRLIDKDGRPITIPVSVPLQGKAKDEWKEHKLFYRMKNARWSDISDYKPDVWLLKPSNLFVSLYQWKTGPLQRLAKLLSRRFFDAKWNFDYNGKKQVMPETIHKVHEFFSRAMQEFPFWRDDMKPKLQETLSLYVGRQALFDLKPDISAIEEWLASQLALSFAADAGGVTTPLEKMGDGWQSLVRIAALDVLSQYPDEINSRVVLLFEEPESFLHPHLTRKLRDVLERLATAGWTVLAATHSPNFVNFSGGQSVVRLTRNGNTVTVCCISTTQIEEAPKFQERIDERGAHEMLFAQKAVLVEGQDDVFALRSYLKKHANLDLEGRSISIIRTGDVGQLPAFASIASKLGIPWLAVSDEDLQPDGSVKLPTSTARQKLTNIQKPCDAQAQWKQDLEACLKKTVGKATPDWQARHIETKSMADIKADNPDYVTACEKVHAWILDFPEGTTP